VRSPEQEIDVTGREAVLVEDAALIQMMGMPVLEAFPLAKRPMN
jgi:hypothetical protein